MLAKALRIFVNIFEIDFIKTRPKIKHTPTRTAVEILKDFLCSAFMKDITRDTKYINNPPKMEALEPVKNVPNNRRVAKIKKM